MAQPTLVRRNAIETLAFDFDVAQHNSAISSPDRMLVAIRQELLATIDQCMDFAAFEAENISIPEITLDLGGFSDPPDWDDVRQRLRNNLLSALAPYLKHPAVQVGKRMAITSTQQTTPETVTKAVSTQTTSGMSTTAQSITTKSLRLRLTGKQAPTPDEIWGAVNKLPDPEVDALIDRINKLIPLPITAGDNESSRAILRDFLRSDHSTVAPDDTVVSQSTALQIKLALTGVEMPDETSLLAALASAPAVKLAAIMAQLGLAERTKNMARDIQVTVISQALLTKPTTTDVQKSYNPALRTLLEKIAFAHSSEKTNSKNSFELIFSALTTNDNLDNLLQKYIPENAYHLKSAIASLSDAPHPDAAKRAALVALQQRIPIDIAALRKTQPTKDHAPDLTLGKLFIAMGDTAEMAAERVIALKRSAVSAVNISQAQRGGVAKTELTTPATPAGETDPTRPTDTSRTDVIGPVSTRLAADGVSPLADDMTIRDPVTAQNYGIADQGAPMPMAQDKTQSSIAGTAHGPMRSHKGDSPAGDETQSDQYALHPPDTPAQSPTSDVGMPHIKRHQAAIDNGGPSGPQCTSSQKRSEQDGAQTDVTQTKHTPPDQADLQINDVAETPIPKAHKGNRANNASSGSGPEDNAPQISPQATSDGAANLGPALGPVDAEIPREDQIDIAHGQGNDKVADAENVNAQGSAPFSVEPTDETPIGVPGPASQNADAGTANITSLTTARQVGPSPKSVQQTSGNDVATNNALDQSTRDVPTSSRLVYETAGDIEAIATNVAPTDDNVFTDSTEVSTNPARSEKSAAPGYGDPSKDVAETNRNGRFGSDTSKKDVAPIRGSVQPHNVASANNATTSLHNQAPANDTTTDDLSGTPNGPESATSAPETSAHPNVSDQTPAKSAIADAETLLDQLLDDLSGIDRSNLKPMLEQIDAVLQTSDTDQPEDRTLFWAAALHAASTSPAQGQSNAATIATTFTNNLLASKENHQLALRNAIARLGFATGPTCAGQAQAKSVLEAILNAKPAAPAQPGPSADLRYDTAVAGLILFHPYIAMLFDRLEIKRDRKGIAPDAQGAARSAFDHLVFGNNLPDLPADALQKCLLGLPPDGPSPNRHTLNQSDTDLIDSLIQSVIDQWGRLGQTSVDGLRAAFVQRGGHLRTGSAAQPMLTVNKGPYDMLLDGLPWAFNLVSLPWMPAPLMVDWRGVND